MDKARCELDKRCQWQCHVSNLSGELGALVDAHAFSLLRCACTCAVVVSLVWTELLLSFLCGYGVSPFMLIGFLLQR
jgi:hypothetical protein